MNSIPFDTHAYVKKLEAAGFTEAQAEVQAQALAELVHDQLACGRNRGPQWSDSRSQIERVGSAIRSDLQTSAILLSYELRLFELRLTLKVAAITAASVFFSTVLVKLL